MLSLCDISLVHLKNAALFETVIPSKISESMGMGLPIIISAPKGQASMLVESSGSGCVLEPEHPNFSQKPYLNLIQIELN